MRTEDQVFSCLAGLVWLGLPSGPTFGQRQLLLKSGFEGQVRVTQDMSDITGIDSNSGLNWEATPEWIESSRFVYHSMAWNREGPVSQWYDDLENFFFLYSDPSGKPLYESRQARAEGRYTQYHDLNGYIFTNVADGNEVPARLRFRDCPGFNLVAENRQYEIRRGRVYHIALEKQGNHFTYTVDGHTLLDTVDDRFNPLHGRGLIGFRTWHTELWWDNLVVTRR